MDDSSLPIVYLGILVVLLFGAAWFLFRQILRTRRVEATFSRLQAKLNKEKGTAQEYYELGSILLDKKLYSQAIAQLQKSLKAKDLSGDENVAVIYNALGFAYAAQEQFDLAIRQYKDALEKQPDYVTAWNNLGFAYEKKQLTAQAFEAYTEALKRDPKNSTAKRRSASLEKRLLPST
ncbi:tetratricopeptide repeat protein [Oscillatoria sp. FACHB-1407]|uniref:tetratricopeptide repeat protein n=1 Tax=Oscillatoria sp. FACHB-1407 TaxID=2692847 RepID=UPI00168335DE|nr:tetratricopeptide repeat protein [Oscillatoria sp. FACHB-1407]MBD2460000.1 tetratricopeptide repeat protein [Oscillatoria sp. FACHB-1407]